MRINRKRFLGMATGSGAAVLLAGCGGGGYGGSSGAPASSCGSTVSSNHGHSVPIAVADLDSSTPRNYDITGGADHGHSITLSPAQLAQLKAGTTISVTSTAGGGDGHSHIVATSCVIY